jgi:hypothetical protein
MGSYCPRVRNLPGVKPKPKEKEHCEGSGDPLGSTEKAELE